MAIKRKIIEIDEELCNGCGDCILSCAEGAIQLIDGKARVISDDLCDGLGACLGECPQDALKIVEREADAFDEAAVEAHLEKKKAEEKDVRPFGCPSRIQTNLKPENNSAVSERPNGNFPVNHSQLMNWPVQIRLISPDTSFLKGADLLVSSDCASVSSPDFHRDFVKGRVVMSGCPKFDDTEEYKNKFTDIFRSCDIKSVTILRMEVPCCGNMPKIVIDGMNKAGVNVPLEIVTLTLLGAVKERKKNAA